MKDRRPRKLKKELKRRFEKVQASKMVRTAMVTAGGAMQVASLSCHLITNPAFPILRTLRAVEISMNTAEAIANILNESPKNWREA